MAPAGPSASSVLKECKAAVSDALGCDGRGASVEAYIKYLSCCAKIAIALLQEATVMTTNFREHRKQLINLAQQCLDRASNLCPTINSREGTGLTAEEVAAVVQSGLVSSTSHDISQVYCAHPREEQQQKQMAPGPAPNSLPPNYPAPELAALQRNRLLVKQHQDKLAKMSRNTASATATLNLSLHRKLVENMAMARAQQTILDQQLLQKRQHMQELAEKRISLLRSQSENGEKKAEQKALLTSVLMYESEQPNVASWRSELRRRPSDADFIHNLCTSVLRCEGHPVHGLLRKYQAQALAAVQSAAVADADIYLDAVVTVPYEDPNEDSEYLTSGGVVNIATYCLICGAVECIGHGTDVEPQHAGNTCNSTDNPGKVTAGSSSVIIDQQPTPMDSELRDSDYTHCSSRSTLSRTEEHRSMSVNGCKPAEEATRLDCNEFDDLFDEDNSIVSTAGGEVHPASSVPSCHPAIGSTTGTTLPNTAPDHKTTSGWQTDVVTPETHSTVLSNSRNSGGSTMKSFCRKWLGEVLAGYGTLAHQLQTSIHCAQKALQELSGTFSVVYEELDMAVAVVEASVQAAVEEEFFAPIHAPLLRLFRLVNISTEIRAACGMTKCQCSNMDSFDVKEKWQLLVTESDTSTDACTPFYNFTRALSRIPHEGSPQQKLKCVVQAHKQLCSEIQNRCSSDGLAKTSVMGADDLLPIICYLTAKSRLPRLVSEYQFMEQFISSKSLMDEEGYCLLTLQAALEYVASLGK